MLTFYKPATGEYLRNLPDTQAALQEAQEARQRVEGALRAEQSGRQQAEARVRQLEEELRRRHQE